MWRSIFIAGQMALLLVQVNARALRTTRRQDGLRS